MVCRQEPINVGEMDWTVFSWIGYIKSFVKLNKDGW